MRRLFLCCTLAALLAGCGTTETPPASASAEPASARQPTGPVLVVKVDSISCEGCCNTIKEEIAALPGVTHVEADPETKLVEIEVADAGFDSQVVLDRLNEIKYDKCEVVKDVKN